MKPLITGLLKGRKTRWGVLVAVIATAGLSVAWLGPNHYRLGGGFIGSPARSGGSHWTAYQAPLDAAGKTAALRVNMHSYSATGAALLAASGADALTEGIGQLEMISNDTAKGSLVFHGVKSGSIGVPPVVKQIWVWEGAIKFSDANSYDVEGTILVYGADADADGDGLPDPGATPLFPPIPNILGVTRVQ